jgi:hypothetical protein
VTIITKEQLREEIGGTTKDKRFASFIGDETLQDIIDHHTRAVVNSIFVLLARGIPDTLRVLFRDVTLPVIEGRVAIPSGLFPYPLRVVADGEHLDMTPDLELRRATSRVPVYGFVARGDEIIIEPDTAEEAVVSLAQDDELVRAITPEAVLRARELILRDAINALSLRIVDFERGNA